MAFLDVDIPDWLKPPSPAQESQRRFEAAQAGLRMGFQAAQQQKQMDHAWEMEKMRMIQQNDQFNQSLGLEREKFGIDKQLDRQRLELSQRELKSQPLIIDYFKNIGLAKTPEEVNSVALPETLTPHGMALVQNARQQRTSELLRVKAASTEQQLYNHWLNFSDRLSARGHTALASEVLGIVGDGSKGLTPENVERLKAIANVAQTDEFKQRKELIQAEWNSRMEIERMRQGNKSPAIGSNLTREQLDAYQELIKGKTADQISDINEAFGMPRLKMKSADDSVATPEKTEGFVSRWWNWMQSNPAEAEALSNLNRVYPLTGTAARVISSLIPDLKNRQKKEESNSETQETPQIPPVKKKYIWDDKSNSLVPQ